MFFTNREKHYYGELKKYITNKLNLSCQAALEKSFTGHSALSVAGKIVLQMHAKMGVPIWTVPIKHSYFKNRLIMVGGLSVAVNMRQS